MPINAAFPSPFDGAAFATKSTLTREIVRARPCRATATTVDQRQQRRSNEVCGGRQAVGTLEQMSRGSLLVLASAPALHLAIVHIRVPKAIVSRSDTLQKVKKSPAFIQQRSKTREGFCCAGAAEKEERMEYSGCCLLDTSRPAETRRARSSCAIGGRVCSVSFSRPETNKQQRDPHLSYPQRPLPGPLIRTLYLLTGLD